MFLFQVKNLKMEKNRLHAELQQQKTNTIELKRKITLLEEKLNSSEEENALLKNFNEIFGDENDKLTKENESLKQEISKFQRFRIPSSLVSQGGRKRSKSCPNIILAEEDEQEAVRARVSFL